MGMYGIAAFKRSWASLLFSKIAGRFLAGCRVGMSATFKMHNLRWFYERFND
jgi:hypothetical protein